MFHENEKIIQGKEDSFFVVVAFKNEFCHDIYWRQSESYDFD